jgi:hypothetical protein
MILASGAAGVKADRQMRLSAPAARPLAPGKTARLSFLYVGRSVASKKNINMPMEEAR